MAERTDCGSKRYEEKLCSSCGHNDICFNHFPGGCSMYFKAADRILAAKLIKTPEVQVRTKRPWTTLQKMNVMVSPHKGY